MDDVNIASITATAYENHIDNFTENAYCAHVYDMPSNPDSEFLSAINQRAEISKMIVSIVSIATSDTPSKNISDPIIGHMEKLEYHIFDILGPEAVVQFKANIGAV